MELKIEQVAIPEKIVFNYEELKQELTDKVKMYETLVYTDGQIREAKADRADLNRLKKALNDERIRREKEYIQPFNAFKAQINEIIGIIDKPVALIDKQVKDYEEKQRQDKKRKIQEYFTCVPHPEWLELSMIFDSKWLNATAPMKAVQGAIDTKIAVVEDHLATINKLPEFAFEATEVYKTTLDLNKAIAEGSRLSEIQKRKAEQERIRQEQEKAKAEKEERSSFTFDRSKETVNPKDAEMAMPKEHTHIVTREWVSFKAFITIDDARALAEFFRNRNIDFRKI